MRPTNLIPPNWKRVNGEQVSVSAIPYYVGPWQYLKRSLQVKRAARNAVGEQDAVILRPSSTIADCIEPLLKRTSHPYGVEVVADPYDTFAPGSVTHPLRPFFRWLNPRKLRHQCVNTAAAAYVTQFALQRRYPPHLHKLLPRTFEMFSYRIGLLHLLLDCQKQIVNLP